MRDTDAPITFVCYICVLVILFNQLFEIQIPRMILILAGWILLVGITFNFFDVFMWLIHFIKQRRGK